MKTTAVLFKAILQSLGFLCSFCILMLLARIIYVRDYTFIFLVWNLFLAIVPLILAMIFSNLYKNKGLVHPASISLLGLWLLFFPNSPYIITDLIHLANVGVAVPLWYDALMIFSFAFSGVVAGFFSLCFIYNSVKGYLKEHQSFFLMAGIFILTGYGIYLGRVLRWNSWDALTKPHHIIADIYSNADDPAAWGFTAIFGAFLFFVWSVFKFFISRNGRKVIRDEFD